MTLPAVGLNGGATDWFPLPGSYAARLADPLQLAEAVQAAVGRRVPGGVDGRLSGSSFIGRTAELAALRSAIDEAERGRGRVVALIGEGGIGKTRLAQHAAAQARACGFTVCWGHCHDTAGAPPYWAWLQVLRACGQNSSAAAGRQARATDAIAALLPTSGRCGAGGASEAQRFRFFGQVAAMLKQAARGRPLLILLEDLHWADAPTVDLLQFAAREITDVRMLIVGSFRNDEAPLANALAEALSRLQRDPAVERLELRGLNAQEVGAQIAAAASRQPPRAFAQAVFQRSDGNPFCVQEMLRCVLDCDRACFDDTGWSTEPCRAAIPMPDSVSAAIQRRLAHLPEDARSVLGSAAVIGREFTFNALLPLVALPAARLLATLSGLAAARVLVPVSGRAATYRFAHALIRETLYAGLSCERRARLHQQAGTALARAYGGAADQHAAELAHHFWHSGDRTRALRYAVRAAQDATTQMAHEEAARHYGVALAALDGASPPDDVQRVELLIDRAEALWRCGGFTAARAAARAAVKLARWHGWAAALARAALAFAGRPLRFAAVVWDPQTIALLEEALRALGDGATALHARVMARLAEELTFAGQRTRCETLARQAIDAARQLGDPSVISAVLHSLYWALWSPDRALERLALAQEMVPLADAVGDRTTAFAAHLLRGLARLELCNVVAARQELGACAQQASALRQPYADWLVACTGVCLSFAEGRLDEVEALLAHCLAVGEATESPNVVLFHAVQRAHLYWLRGCGDETQALLDALGRTHSAVAPAVRCVAALTFAEQGRLAEARAALASAASDHFRAARRNATWLMSIALLAEACAVLGDRERATALYELLRPFAGRSVVLAPALHFGVADHFLGVLAATVGRWDHAARHFQEALILNARMGTRQWLARSEIAYAELLAAHCGPERAEEARRLADEALASAERLRLAPVARRARALLDTLPASRTTAASHGAGPPGSIDRPTSTLHRAGDFWILTHRGTTCHLKHSKAVCYLAQLLLQPMRELHVLDLVAIANGNGSATIVQNGLGPALDARARVDLRATRIDLSAQLEEAEQWNDEGRSRDLRAKLQTLEEYVLANYGLGGRARNGKASAEQARQAVTKGITATRRRIAQHHPALGRHFEAYVRTGYLCSYKPPPEDPITWVVGGA